MTLISLAACSTAPQRIEVTSKPIQKPELILPGVDQVTMRKIEWIIIQRVMKDEKSKYSQNVANKTSHLKNVKLTF